MHINVSTFYLILGLLVAVSIILGVLTWRTRKNPDRASRVAAWLELVVALTGLTFFGWLMLNGFVDGEVWFGSRSVGPYLVVRAFAPVGYWLVQGIYIAATLGFAFLVYDGFTRVRRRYLGG